MKMSRWVLAGLLLMVLAAAQTQTAPSLTKAQVEEIKTKNARLVELNGLITQVTAAMQAKDWPKTKNLAEKLIVANAKLVAAYPDDASFSAAEPGYYQLLGNTHFNLGEYDDAVAAYEKCVGLSQALRDGGKDSPALKKIIGQALTSEGNAFLKSKKNKEAIACFGQAAEIDPHPDTAWFNLCATMYNVGDTDGAVAVADKVIALDPTKADAYFIKGSCLFGNGTVNANGKMVVPAEALAALRKYLELAPNGAHVGDVKQMLEFAGVHVP